MKDSQASTPDDLKSIIDSMIHRLESKENAELTTKILHLMIREGIQEPHDLAQKLGISDSIARFEKAKLFAQLRQRIRQRDLRQNANEATETAPSIAMPERKETAIPLPPRNAEFLLALFLNKQDQEVAIGCFAELYGKRVERWGNSRARIWAWIEVGKMVVPLLKRAILKVSGLVAAYEWLKHHIR